MVRHILEEDKGIDEEQNYNCSIQYTIHELCESVRKENQSVMFIIFLTESKFYLNVIIARCHNFSFYFWSRLVRLHEHIPAYRETWIQARNVPEES